MSIFVALYYLLHYPGNIHFYAFMHPINCRHKNLMQLSNKVQFIYLVDVHYNKTRSLIQIVAFVFLKYYADCNKKSISVFC